MKKLVLSIFAVAALASCFQNEELVGAGNNTSIEFADAYVGGVTKAIDGSYSNTNMFDKFQVYGTLENNGAVANIFAGVDVMKGGAGWYYDDAYTTYWISGNTYDFKAVVAGNEAGETAVAVDANGMPTTITLSDASAQNDILYAEKLDINYTGNAEPVRFVFEHLLAKAKVSVRNIIPVDNGGYYVVKDVKLTKAIESAIYTIDTKNWADYTGDYVLEFGHIVAANETAAGANAIELGYEGKGSSNYERLIVPQASCPLTISINYAYYDRNGAEHLSPVVKEISTVANIEAGKAYNFVLTLAEPGEKIEFDVQDVTDWEEELPVYEGTTVYVADAAELTAAINNPDVAAVVLTEDVTLDSTITRAEGAGVTIAKSFTIDGNGNTLTYTGSGRAIDIKSDVENETYKNVTIKNLTINCSASYCERGINYNANGSLILDNVKVGGQSVSYALNFPGKADNATVQILNSELTGLIALNVWGEDMEIYVTNSILTSVENNAVENYAAVSLNADASSVAEGTVVNIEGGKVIARDENGEPAIAVRNATSTGVVNISESTEVVGIVTHPVAAVYYNNTTNSYLLPTLQAAIDKAIESNAAGVSLLKDIELDAPLTIPAGKPVVLDLNGKTLSGVDTGTANFGLVNISAGANLTVQGGGKLQLSATNNRGWNAYSSVISNQRGTLLVKGGVVIEHLGGTDMAYGIDNLTNGKGTEAVTTIEDATVKSTYRAVRQFLNGVEATNELYVKNGAVIEGANKSVWMQDPNKNANPGKLVVEAGAQLKGDVYLFVTAGSTEWPVEVSIASAALVDGSEVLTGNVPAGYAVVEENGVWSVISGTAVAEGLLLLNDCYYVSSGEGFKNLATQVLNDGTKSVVAELANDIDLAGIEWPAVKVAAALVLDGKGHIIKNLSTSAVEDHGFYSTAMFTSTRKATTIKNLVVENATVTGKGGDNSHGAVLVACNYAALTISGVTVKNSTISNCDRTGGLLTYLYFTTATVENCVVVGCTINSIGTAGAILGMNNSHDFTMKGCQVVNTTVSSSEGSNKAGIFIGTWQDAGTLTSEGNTHSGSKAINAGTETNNEIGRHA